jgi:hypothetical protein
LSSKNYRAIAIATAKPAVAPADGKLVNCDPSTPGNLAEPSKTIALPADVPVFKTAAVPSPSDVRAVPAVSSTKLEPSPTIKPPSVTANPATSCSCASSLALATVPVSCAASMLLFVSVSVVALPTRVSVAAGKVTVTSAVAAGPIRVTAFVPLSVSSLNSIEPAEDAEPVSMGAVILLFVRCLCTCKCSYCSIYSYIISISSNSCTTSDI